VAAELIHMDRRTDRWKDVTERIGTLRDYSNALKNQVSNSVYCFSHPDKHSSLVELHYWQNDFTDITIHLSFLLLCYI